MKAATTSLFNWLGTVEGVDLPESKEVQFYSGQSWDRGLDWYRSLFPTSATVTGEASPGYTDPARAEVAASRIRKLYPDIKMIFIAREPADRARSHYRHFVQRGRENRPFAEAAEPTSEYITTSLYSRALAPYLDLFPSSQLLIVRFDLLVGPTEDGWKQVLDFLDLPATARPSMAHNETAGKKRFTGPLLKIWDKGLLRHTRHLPRWTRSVGKTLLTSNTARYRELLASSSDELPEESELMLQRERLDLERLIGEDIWAGRDGHSRVG